MINSDRLHTRPIRDREPNSAGVFVANPDQPLRDADCRPSVLPSCSLVPNDARASLPRFAAADDPVTAAAAGRVELLTGSNPPSRRRPTSPPATDLRATTSFHEP